MSAWCAEIAPKKMFGWLRNITNSAAKNSAAAQRRLTKFGEAAAQGSTRASRCLMDCSQTVTQFSV